jgi:hypothetical protein
MPRGSEESIDINKAAWVCYTADLAAAAAAAPTPRSLNSCLTTRAGRAVEDTYADSGAPSVTPGEPHSTCDDADTADLLSVTWWSISLL